jgi:hypothetical protein
VTAISDLMQALRYATREDKAEIDPALKAGTRHSISADRRGCARRCDHPVSRAVQADMRVLDEALAPVAGACRGGLHCGEAGHIRHRRLPTEMA